MVRISDKQVIELLEQKGRKPASHIAAALGVTETAIRKRIAKLEEKGIITQHTVRVSPRKSAYTIVFIGVDAKPEGYMQVSREVVKKPFVKRAYSTSGDHQLQLECWFESDDAFREYIQELEDNSNIVKVCPGIVQEQLK